jgi:hypothetical protein
MKWADLLLIAALAPRTSNLKRNDFLMAEIWGARTSLLTRSELFHVPDFFHVEVSPLDFHT